LIKYKVVETGTTRNVDEMTISSNFYTGLRAEGFLTFYFGNLLQTGREEAGGFDWL
jgi:hypothetical protein